MSKDERDNNRRRIMGRDLEHSFGNQSKEYLLSAFDKVQETESDQTEFIVNEYERQCEEYLQIDKIYTLHKDKRKLLLLIVLNIFTLFLINLFLVWFPKLKLIFLFSKCKMDHSTHLGIFGKDKQFYVIEIKELDLPNIQGSHIPEAVKVENKSINISSGNRKIKMFEYKLFKYYYSHEKKTFRPYNFNLGSSAGTYSDIETKYSRGLTKPEVEYMHKLFGKCDLEIEVDSMFKLVVKEITDPFYVFQIFSVILWLNNEYIKYAIVIIISTVISLFIGVVETRKNLVSVKQMARFSCEVKIIRNKENRREEIACDSSELVPGDIFEIPDDNAIIPCDCLLISGTVIMNESILTGESIPIIKQPIPRANTPYDESDSKSILFSGTRIVQKRSAKKQKTIALVLKTGFSTEKGSLIRAILFPKENNFKIKEDSISYIKIMTCLSITGFLISLPFMIKNGIPTVNILFRAMDLITTTVPPALPACIGIGISYALMRIKDKGIICINRDRVNEAGKIDMICFDKTGTLTEDFLDVYGFRPVKYTKGSFCFGNFMKDCDQMEKETYAYVKSKHAGEEGILEGNKSDEIKSYFIECLASCHSITRVKDKLIGDPIDVKMFECSKWVLNENLNSDESEDSLISTFVHPPQEKPIKDKLKNCEDNEEEILRTHYELGIVRRFDFSSKLQRMSVISKNVNEDYFKVFTKGSPEKIRELCKPHSIPDNFNEILAKYTQKGFRVLALAFKIVKMDYVQSQQLPRERVEAGLSLLGLLVVQNKLKSETTGTIRLLRQANMKMLMATGDNILTAVSVAKECHLIDPEAKIYQFDLHKEEKKLSWNLLDNFDENSSENGDETFEQAFKMRSRKATLEEDPLRLSKFSAEVITINTDVSSSHILQSDQEPFQSNIINTNNQTQNRDSISDITIEKDFHNLNMNQNIAIAVTGHVFDILCRFKNKYLHTNNSNMKYYHEAYKFILQKATIFARMSPDHKTNLVEALKEDEYKVMMCGDGANDCGALRAANVGVSLSIEEASIAAHFTATKADISCLKTILIEGKAALVTTIQCFKYMMLYSVIQFASVTMMVILGTYLSDNQFLMSDLFLIFPLAFLIAKTESVEILTPAKPIANLKSIQIVASILLQASLQFLVQLTAYLLLKTQHWFVPLVTDISQVEPSSENTTVFLISYLQYLITAVAFSIGKPFKKELSSNSLLLVFLILTFSHGYYLMLISDDFSNWLFTLVYLSGSLFKCGLIIISVFNCVVSIWIEKHLIPKICRYFKQ